MKTQNICKGLKLACEPLSKHDQYVWHYECQKQLCSHPCCCPLSLGPLHHLPSKPSLPHSPDLIPILQHCPYRQAEFRVWVLSPLYSSRIEQKDEGIKRSPSLCARCLPTSNIFGLMSHTCTRVSFFASDLSPTFPTARCSALWIACRTRNATSPAHPLNNSELSFGICTHKQKLRPTSTYLPTWHCNNGQV